MRISRNRFGKYFLCVLLLVAVMAPQAALAETGMDGSQAKASGEKSEQDGAAQVLEAAKGADVTADAIAAPEYEPYSCRCDFSNPDEGDGGDGSLDEIWEYLWDDNHVEA